MSAATLQLITMNDKQPLAETGPPMSSEELAFVTIPEKRFKELIVAEDALNLRVNEVLSPGMVLALRNGYLIVSSEDYYSNHVDAEKWREQSKHDTENSNSV